MRRTRNVHFVHLVWATKNREPLLTPELERLAHRSIGGIAEELGCVVRALNGMPDHIHLLLWLPTPLSVAETMKRIKGGSSAFANDVHNHEIRFRWQPGYSVSGVPPEGLDKVIAYIRNQKTHHANGDLIAEWEETDEEAPELPE